MGRAAHRLRGPRLARVFPVGIAHSIVGGSAWEPTPWRAVQRAAWETLGTQILLDDLFAPMPNGGRAMTMAPLVLALAAGAMSASFALCLRLAAGGINPALGALIVSATALPFSLGVFIAMRDAPTGVAFGTRSTVLMILAGVFAASTTIFGMLAYTRGFKLSSSPVVTATQMSLLLIVGVVALDEPLGAGRCLALALIVLGVFLLQRAGV